MEVSDSCWSVWGVELLPAPLSAVCCAVWPWWQGHDMLCGDMFLMLSCFSEKREQHPQWRPPSHYILLEAACCLSCHSVTLDFSSNAVHSNLGSNQSFCLCNRYLFCVVTVIWRVAASLISLTVEWLKRARESYVREENITVHSQKQKGKVTLSQV